MEWTQTSEGWTLYDGSAPKATAQPSGEGWWRWMLVDRLEAGNANSEAGAKAAAEAAVIR